LGDDGHEYKKKGKTGFQYNFNQFQGGSMQIKKTMKALWIVLMCGCIFSLFAKIEGFYKDVFQDEGTQINGGNLEIDCAYIGYSQEHLNTEDKTFQATIMIKNTDDANGYFLYPDGMPRFAIIYYHGGMMGHATDLGAEGIKLVRKHYFNGGCQFGSCAGSYMLSNNASWFNIWPGKMTGNNVSGTPIDKIIPKNSPLIGRNGIKEGDIIPGVYHNNGGSVDTAKPYPAGTVFCTFHNSGTMKGFADIWSWKDHDSTGRVAGSTGHPEGSTKQDQVRYFSALMLYLTDCLGKPRIKSTLKNGASVIMDKKWEDNSPQNTMIGDKQYHHFILDCKSAKNVKIKVTGKEGFDFHLFVAKDTFAFKQKAAFADTAAGAAKLISIDNLDNGKWYVGVKLNTTVTADTAATGFPKYSGKLEVLNGISYTITAVWDEAGIIAGQAALYNQVSLLAKNKTIIINTGAVQLQRLQVFDMKGRLCFEPRITTNSSQFVWTPQSRGAYIVRLMSKNESYTKKITVAQ
jgi:hypothetical protein